MSTTTIYKKDTKGRIRQLSIWCDSGMLYQESGLVGGKLITHSKLCKPKNIGKANFRNSTAQASLQMGALIIKKLREGYFVTAEKAETEDIILPMLAYDFFKHRNKIQRKNMALQPKLDGVRCLMFYNAEHKTLTAVSRTNVPIKYVDHIRHELLAKLYYELSDIVLDGELYVHGNTFQENTKLLNNKPTSEFIEYHIYDMIDTKAKFVDRISKIEALLGWDGIYVKIVPTTLSVTADLDDFYVGYIDEGYEGMMVRDKTSMYKVSGRSDRLLKYKKFIDISLPIQDITPNDSNAKHGTVWVTFKGKLQKTGAKLSHADREELLTNRDSMIGLMAEIRYFEETDDGKMRFPVYHGIRIDK